jgi:uncharacterized protein (DUF2147 family)
LLSLAVPRVAVAAGVPTGVWLINAKAVQIFACGGLLCGRIVWLQHPRDQAGQLVRDLENPESSIAAASAVRPNFSPGLQPADIDHWESGWLYNPDDGKTYRVRAELGSADSLVARIYLGIPFSGETWTLLRVPRLSSEGWC